MASFLLSELADMGVYTPLPERRLALAVLASGLVVAIVDSAVFLLLAFGNLAYLEGLIVGKLWASLAAFGLLIALRLDPISDQFALELSQAGHDGAHELAARGAEIEAEARLGQDTNFPGVQVVECLDEVLGAPAPAAELGD